MKNWMSFIDDKTRLTNLMIPGTHDTMSTVDSAPQNDLSITQNEQLIVQLDQGIRCLDIRIRVYQPGANADHATFEMHHGLDYLHEDFRAVLYTCHRFLEENPSETIIMMIQNHARNMDNAPDPTVYEDVLLDYILAEEHNVSMHKADERKPPRTNRNTPIPPWFFTTSNLKTELAEVRGKIVLWRQNPRAPLPAQPITAGELNLPARISREAFSGFEGLNVSGMKNEAMEYIPQQHLYYQNYYKSPEVADKKAAIQALLDKSIAPESPAAPDSPPINAVFVCFVSAAGQPGSGWTPKYYASLLNPWFHEQIRFKTLPDPAARYRGVYLMDFPSQEIITDLIRWNFGDGVLPPGIRRGGLNSGWMNPGHHPASQGNTLYIAPGALGTIELIGDATYGIVNLRFKNREGQIIHPQKSWISPKKDAKKDGDGWLTPDFGGQFQSVELHPGLHFLGWGFDDHGLVSIDYNATNRQPVAIGFPGMASRNRGAGQGSAGLIWLQTYREGGYGIRDIRLNYE